MTTPRVLERLNRGLVFGIWLEHKHLCIFLRKDGEGGCFVLMPRQLIYWPRFASESRMVTTRRGSFTWKETGENVGKVMLATPNQQSDG